LCAAHEIVIDTRALSFRWRSFNTRFPFRRVVGWGLKAFDHA
jgi:hypothetical protein